MQLDGLIRWVLGQVVLPHIKGTMEDLHVGEVMATMPLAKHLPNGLVDASAATRLRTFISRFLEVCKTHNVLVIPILRVSGLSLSCWFFKM